MPAQLPFHFGPALRPTSHGNPAGPGNPLFHRTARVFGDATVGTTGLTEQQLCVQSGGYWGVGTGGVGGCTWPEAQLPTRPTAAGADQTGATVSTTPPTASPASPPVVPSSSSYFTAPVLIGAALLYWLLLK